MCLNGHKNEVFWVLKGCAFFFFFFLGGGGGGGEFGGSSKPKVAKLQLLVSPCMPVRLFACNVEKLRYRFSWSLVWVEFCQNLSSYFSFG